MRGSIRPVTGLVPSDYQGVVKLLYSVPRRSQHLSSFAFDADKSFYKDQLILTCTRRNYRQEDVVKNSIRSSCRQTNRDLTVVHWHRTTQRLEQAPTPNILAKGKWRVVKCSPSLTIYYRFNNKNTRKLFILSNDNQKVPDFTSRLLEPSGARD